MPDLSATIVTPESESAASRLPPDNEQSLENINWRKSNVVFSWCYLNAVSLVLFALSFASSLFNILYSSWMTGGKCSEARLRNDTAEEESSIRVSLWSFCNVHLIDDGGTVVKNSNCSTWDAETLPVWFHGVQLATVFNMLSITVCLILAGFSWLCCRHNHRRIFASVCFSAVCSVVAQSIGLGFFLNGDVSSLFAQLKDAVDGTSCRDYRFIGYGWALALSVMSLTATVAATLLQPPISWTRSILSANRIHNGLISQLSDERTRLIQRTLPGIRSETGA